MHKISAFLIAVIFMGMSSIVLARADGGGGHTGGVSSGHVSEKSMANTNGPNAADRDKGMERAEDRMSQQGIDHQKAGSSGDSKSAHNDHGKGKHKGHN